MKHSTFIMFAVLKTDGLSTLMLKWRMSKRQDNRMHAVCVLGLYANIKSSVKVTNWRFILSRKRHQSTVRLQPIQTQRGKCSKHYTQKHDVIKTVLWILGAEYLYSVRNAGDTIQICCIFVSKHFWNEFNGVE